MSPSLDFNFNLSTLIKIGIPLKKEITLNLICIFTLPSILFSTNLGVIFKYIFSQLNIFIIFPYMALINVFAYIIMYGFVLLIYILEYISTGFIFLIILISF